MRKTNCLVATLLITALLVTGCYTAPAPAPTYDPEQQDPLSEYLSQIYEIGSFNYDGYCFHHYNVIDDDPVITTDRASYTEWSNLAGQTYFLQYECTKYWPVGDEKTLDYRVSNSDADLSLYEDGSFHSMVGTIAELPVQKNDTPETVRSLLEPFLSTYIDLSEYQYINAEPSPFAKESDFFAYYFTYSKDVCGYQSSMFLACVTSDGIVQLLLQKGNLSVDPTQMVTSIDKDLEEKLITAKLKAIVDADHTEYRNHTQHDSPRITYYKNELHIEYRFDVEIFFDGESPTYEGVHTQRIQLLIPLSLLTDTQLSSQLK